MSEIDEIQKEINQLNNQLTKLNEQRSLIAQEIVKKMGVVEYLQKKEKVDTTP